MITVQEATQIIQSRQRDYGMETVPFDAAQGRVLGAPIIADRDLPPFDRATMDGIAIRYAGWEAGLRSFRVLGTMAAGDVPIATTNPAECIEIMTGAAVPPTVDTVIRYEDVAIRDGMATVHASEVRNGQNIHFSGSDKQQGSVLIAAGETVTPAVVQIAASVGASLLRVRKLPRVAIISTGNELVAVAATPGPYQIRRSNSYAIRAALQPFGMEPDMLHLPDDPATMERELALCLQSYDVLILSGGVSMGKFDYLDGVLQVLAVQKQFHRVRQRPGKPFWFGEHPSGPLVFAFPGNPVSAFMCLYRYFLPWLKGVLGMTLTSRIHALLGADYIFKPDLQCFLPVRLLPGEHGQWLAMPVPGNTSGDFAGLAVADAFMELPAEEPNFKKGTRYPVWPFKPLFT